MRSILEQKALKKLPDWRSVLGIFAVTIFFMLTVHVLELTAFRIPNKVFVLLGGVLLFCFLALLLVSGIDKKPEWLFLMLFVPISVAFLFAIPLGMVPDEVFHFVRSLSLSDGQLFITEVQCPVNWRQGVSPDFRGMEVIAQAKQVLFSQDEMVGTSLGGALFYPPISYLPQAIGMFIARLFTQNIYIVGCAGRLLSCGAVAAILFFCVRYLPTGKWILIAASFSAMLLQEVGSLAADGLTFAVVAADITFLLYHQNQRRLMSKKARWLLLVLIVVTLTVKPLYVPLGFLFLLLPQDCFASKKEKGKLLWLCYGVGLALLFGWLLFAMTSGSASASSYNDANIMEQLKIVFLSPLQFFIRMYRTILRDIINLFGMMQGNFLGLEVATTHFEIILYFGAFIWITTRDQGLSPLFAKSLRRNLLLGVMGCIVVVYLMEYLQFTPVNKPVVDGVQGRYLLPILFPLALAMKSEPTDQARPRESTPFLALALIFALDWLAWIKICEYLYY